MPDLGLAKRLERERKEKERADGVRVEKALIKAEALRKAEEARIKQETEDAYWAEHEEERLAMEREKWEAAEIVRKTKKYWKLNEFSDEQDSIAMNPTYFGEHITDHKGDAWVPHGKGKFLVGDEPIIEGTYKKGYLHGNATHSFDDDSKWEGEYKDGYMEGIGYYTTAQEDPVYDENGAVVGSPPKQRRREAIARRNILMCYKDELGAGKQVEFNDHTMHVITNTRRPRATIMHHVRGWKFRCHFHDEIRPRERDVVFSSIRDFKVLHHLPLIYHTTEFGVCNDPPVRYDYYQDVYVTRKKKSQIRQTLDLHPVWFGLPLYF